MFVSILLCLVATAIAVEIPRPKLVHLASGEIEISVDPLPGTKIFDAQYSIKGKDHRGPFHQAANGRWFHRNFDAGFTGQDHIIYTLTGEINGEPVVSQGKIYPESAIAVLPPKRLRRGTVIYREDFNGAFNPAGWDYEVSMYGGYNWEVQAYVQDARNIFTRNGHLFIKPTLTTDDPRFTEATLTTGVMDMKALYGYCTNADRYGCYRQGRDGILPPVMSGKLKSKKTIRFGKVEVRARTPRGDWIWPAIWMLPRDSVYGSWPRSGEIDIMESRGNLQANGNQGVTEVCSTMHWGPDAGQNKYTLTHGCLQGDWSYKMHTYVLEWTEHHIQVFVDGRMMMNIPINTSFWHKGGFSGGNIWGSNNAAPFDQQFYLILNVAIAGTNGFFPDNWSYNTPKPWKNNSPTELQDFWNGRHDWLPTWHGDDVAMEIDYVEMTQY